MLDVLRMWPYATIVIVMVYIETLIIKPVKTPTPPPKSTYNSKIIYSVVKMIKSDRSRSFLYDYYSQFPIDTLIHENPITFMSNMINISIDPGQLELTLQRLKMESCDLEQELLEINKYFLEVRITKNEIGTKVIKLRLIKDGSVVEEKTLVTNDK